MVFLSLCWMDLSIVIPVYNEEQKIRDDITAASDFLSRHKITGEIIVVDDGSSDQTSKVVKSTIVDEDVSLKILGYKEHTGKGRAVRTGVMEAGSDLIMFIDSGNCVPFENISRGIALLKDGKCEIAHASRFLPGSIIKRSRTAYRKLVSFLFRKYIRILSRIPGNLTDTQCGLKIYRRETAHDLYGACITDGFLFDVEIILRAREEGYQIQEFPIEWTSDPDSRLSVGRTLLSMFSELRSIRKALKFSRQDG